MNVLITEDDVIQNKNLAKMIKKSYSNIGVLSAFSIKESREVIENEDIDLFFIDINLPDGSGLELAKAIRKMEGHELKGIVFLTTETYEIIDVFKSTHCYDYLIKPYNEEDIKNIISVFTRERIEEKEEYRGYSVVGIDGNIKYKLYHEDIIFVECASRKCKIYGNKTETLYCNIALANLLKEIESENIMKCHKSFIVNIRYIQKIEKKYSKLWIIHFKNSKETIELSIKYKNQVFKSWENIKCLS